MAEKPGDAKLSAEDKAKKEQQVKKSKVDFANQLAEMYITEALFLDDMNNLLDASEIWAAMNNKDREQLRDPLEEEVARHKHLILPMLEGMKNLLPKEIVTLIDSILKGLKEEIKKIELENKGLPAEKQNIKLKKIHELTQIKIKELSGLVRAKVGDYSIQNIHDSVHLEVLTEAGFKGSKIQENIFKCSSNYGLVKKYDDILVNYFKKHPEKRRENTPGDYSRLGISNTYHKMFQRKGKYELFFGSLSESSQLEQDNKFEAAKKASQETITLAQERLDKSVQTVITFTCKAGLSIEALSLGNIQSKLRTLAGDDKLTITKSKSDPVQILDHEGQELMTIISKGNTLTIYPNVKSKNWDRSKKLAAAITGELLSVADKAVIDVPSTNIAREISQNALNSVTPNKIDRTKPKLELSESTKKLIQKANLDQKQAKKPGIGIIDIKGSSANIAQYQFQSALHLGFIPALENKGVFKDLNLQVIISHPKVSVCHAQMQAAFDAGLQVNFTKNQQLKLLDKLNNKKYQGFKSVSLTTKNPKLAEIQFGNAIKSGFEPVLQNAQLFDTPDQVYELKIDQLDANLIYKQYTLALVNGLKPVFSDAARNKLQKKIEGIFPTPEIMIHCINPVEALARIQEIINLGARPKLDDDTRFALMRHAKKMEIAMRLILSRAAAGTEGEKIKDKKWAELNPAEQLIRKKMESAASPSEEELALLKSDPYAKYYEKYFKQRSEDELRLEKALKTSNLALDEIRADLEKYQIKVNSNAPSTALVQYLALAEAGLDLKLKHAIDPSLGMGGKIKLNVTADQAIPRIQQAINYGFLPVLEKGTMAMLVENLVKDPRNLPRITLTSTTPDPIDAIKFILHIGALPVLDPKAEKAILAKIQSMRKQDPSKLKFDFPQKIISPLHALTMKSTLERFGLKVIPSDASSQRLQEIFNKEYDDLDEKYKKLATDMKTFNDDFSQKMNNENPLGIEALHKYLSEFYNRKKTLDLAAQTLDEQAQKLGIHNTSDITKRVEQNSRYGSACSREYSKFIGNAHSNNLRVTQAIIDSVRSEFNALNRISSIDGFSAVLEESVEKSNARDKYLASARDFIEKVRSYTPNTPEFSPKEFTLHNTALNKLDKTLDLLHAATESAVVKYRKHKLVSALNARQSTALANFLRFQRGVETVIIAKQKLEKQAEVKPSDFEAELNKLTKIQPSIDKMQTDLRALRKEFVQVGANADTIKTIDTKLNEIAGLKVKISTAISDLKLDISLGPSKVQAAEKAKVQVPKASQSSTNAPVQPSVKTQAQIPVKAATKTRAIVSKISPRKAKDAIATMLEAQVTLFLQKNDDILKKLPPDVYASLQESPKNSTNIVLKLWDIIYENKYDLRQGGNTQIYLEMLNQLDMLEKVVTANLYSIKGVGTNKIDDNIAVIVDEHKRVLQKSLQELIKKGEGSVVVDNLLRAMEELQFPRIENLDLQTRIKNFTDELTKVQPILERVKSKDIKQTVKACCEKLSKDIQKVLIPPPLPSRDMKPKLMKPPSPTPPPIPERPHRKV